MLGDYKIFRGMCLSISKQSRYDYFCELAKIFKKKEDINPPF